MAFSPLAGGHYAPMSGILADACLPLSSKLHASGFVTLTRPLALSYEIRFEVKTRKVDRMNGKAGSVLCGLAAGILVLSSAAGQSQSDAETAVATFAGGCFWCMEPPFDKLDGVISTTSGYTGGHVENPTYEQVSAGGTGHAESVRVVYDPSVVSYEKLLDVFWHNVDPLDAGGQFCDRGDQYRSEIFYHSQKQKALAEASLETLRESGALDGKVVTRIEPAGPFYSAEDYHQNYYEKNPIRYKFYRYLCGRDGRLDALWPDRERS
jgi:peptide-methionine (S)-S-oxide reductase